MKKWMSLFLALSLILGLGASALAASGNITVWYSMPENGYLASYLRNVILAGNQIYCMVEGTGEKLIVYDLDTNSSSEYDYSGLLHPSDNSFASAEEETEDADENENEEETEEEEIENINEEVLYESEEVTLWFAYQDQPHAVICRNTSRQDGSQTVEGGFVRRLTFENGEPTLVDAGLPQLDWTELIEENDSWSYSRYIRSAFCVDDTLYALSYDDSGNDILLLFDLKFGLSEIHYLQGMSTMVPGPDGQLLATQYDWNTGEGELVLLLYDPASESTRKLSSKAIGDTSVQNLYYSADNNTLYYTSAGEIWAAPEMDLTQAVSVNDCPVSGDNFVQMTKDGYLLLFDSQSAVLRNTDPSQRKEISLTVLDSAYLNSLDSAYFDFTATHGDVSVIIDRNYNASNVLQAMMNQDSSVDIYCLDMASSQFSALFRRGYMAELDSSEQLKALVDSMYPAVSGSVKRNDRLVGIPVYAYGYTLGINQKAFEKLGYSKADLPKTWEDYFRLLDELPSRLEGSGIQAFLQYYTVIDLKMMFFTTILSNYQDYLNTGSDTSYAFNTPVLQNVLDMMDHVNYEALGIKAEQDESSGSFDWGSDTLLFETGVQVTMPTWSDEYEPLFLSFGDEEASGTYHMYVAFINPYSRHIPEAISFLEVLAAHTEPAYAYTFSPENNEPLRYPDYEEYVTSIRETLETARAEIAKTDDPEEQANWQETIDMLEQDLKNSEETYWQISPAMIEAYRARAPILSPMSYDFYNMITDANDNSFYESLQRYYEGQISARDLLEILDQKYQMMRLEGD